MATNSITVTAINRYPVRSCAGEAMSAAQVTPNGLVLDRQWRLARPDGKFLTQTQWPKMALIRPSVVDSRLQLKFADSNQIAPAVRDNPDVPLFRISDQHQGIDQGDEIAEWLGSVLDIEARLLRVRTATGVHDFARPNMSPIEIITEESLADLNSRLSEPVPIDRFRPTYVVSGLSRPYEEDSWNRVQIGDIFYAASTEPCGRCPMININQQTGKWGSKELLKTLIGYRRTPQGVIFGKYLVPESNGTVHIGDKVTVLAA